MNEAERQNQLALHHVRSMSEALNHQRGGHKLAQTEEPCSVYFNRGAKEEQIQLMQTASSQVGGPCEMAHASCHVLRSGFTECFELFRFLRTQGKQRPCQSY